MKLLTFSLLCGALMVSTLSQGQNSGRQDRNKGNQMNRTDSTGSNKSGKKNREQQRGQNNMGRDSASRSGTGTDTAMYRGR